MIIESPKGEINFADLIDFLNRHKKPIIIITLVSGLLGVIFTMPYFIIPKYKASVVVYPTKTSSISKALTGAVSDQFDNLAFGLEADAEQMLQIIESDDIRDRICEKYKLMEHYYIDKSGRYPRHKLYKAYRDNIIIKRTEFMSIEIEVEDESPKLAATIARDIAHMADSLKSKLQQKISKQAYEIVKKQYEEKLAFIKKENDSMSRIGEYGVLNYERQPSVVTEEYAKAKASGNMALAAEMKKLMDNLAKYGPTHHAFYEGTRIEMGHLAELYQKLQQVQMDANEFVSHQYVISNALPSDKPSYPIRSLFVALAMAFGLTSSMIYFSISDNYKKNKAKQQITSEERVEEPVA